MMARQRWASVALGLAFLHVGVAPGRAQDTVIHYHTDAIGSVRMITDNAGQVVARYDFLPFGESWSPPGASDVRQFAGKERDVETGFDYFGARYYNSRQGRFTTPDAAGADLLNPQTFNRYRYALNNPQRYIDRDGFYEEDVHKDLTSALALAAGFSRETALAIGAATQWVDDDPTTDPTGVRNLLDEQMRADYHFTSVARRTSMWAEFMGSRSIAALGEFMHAFQDSYSHRGYEARYGHARAGKTPDKTASDPDKADRMANESYNQLVAATALLRPAKHPVPYARIEKLIAKFNRASDKDKPSVIDEIRQEIQREQ